MISGGGHTSFTYPAGVRPLRGDCGFVPGACAQAKASAAPRASDPSTRKVAPESFTSTPTATAAQAPIKPARAIGAGREPGVDPAPPDDAARIPPARRSRRGVAGRLGEIVGGEPRRRCGDVGEITGAAGVEDGARQVRVPARNQIDEGEERPAAMKGKAIAATTAADPLCDSGLGQARKARDPAAANRATAAPTGSTIAAPTSAPKRPRAKTTAATTPREERRQPHPAAHPLPPPL